MNKITIVENNYTITTSSGDKVVVPQKSVSIVSAGTQGAPGVGVPTGGATGQVLKKLSGSNYDTSWQDDAGGITDHGALTGLADDDHTQYHNDARGDARYYTQSQITTLLAGKANTSHTHAAGDITSGTFADARIAQSNVTQHQAALSIATSQLTGTLGIGSGGTGQTTANAALNALLPAQSGNNGKYLTTNGTNTSWASGGASPGGSSGQIQYNNGGSFGGAAAMIYATSGTHVTITSQTSTDIALQLKAASGQTVNTFEQLNASNQRQFAFTADGKIAIHTNGSSRFGTLSYDDPAGSYVFGRSDSSNTFRVVVNSSSVDFRTGGNAYFLGGSTAVITGTEGGGQSTVDLNRRLSDSSSGVGGTVNCWTFTGQTSSAFRVLAPGGGSALYEIYAGGGVKHASIADASAPNNSTYYSTTANKLVYKDSGGTVNALY